MMENLITITTLNQLEELILYLKDKEYVAFDTETTGLDKDAKIIGYSVCAEVDTAYYVILLAWENNELKELPTNAKTIDILKILQTKHLIMHNAIFDCRIVEDNYQISLINSVHTDTMLLAHLLDENRAIGLKDLGISIFGEDAKKEQIEMKESVAANGGLLTKSSYELYKADANLIAKYGAKDALLTLKLFYHLGPQLFEEGLDEFFYEQETMPLLRTATYQLNTKGLRVDVKRLETLKFELESECLELKSFIYNEIDSYVKEEYPGTGKTNVFNIGSDSQIKWLLFYKLDNLFDKITDAGRDLCHAFQIKLPYSNKAKYEFIKFVKDNKDKQYVVFDNYTKKQSKPKKVRDYWHYLACDKDTLLLFAKRYKWVDALLKYNKTTKLLETYVIGIQKRLRYGIIYPEFKQSGTKSGRYSSKNPNFQNLPRDDKRIKSCVVSRPGMVFVGADQSQLEPRVFASLSGDKRLQKCFSDGLDFYSVIGQEVYEKYDCSLKKDEPNSFANKYQKLRQEAKVFSLAATYGTTAHKMAPVLKKSVEETENTIESYFLKFPSVKNFMISCHNEAKTSGVVKSLFGRPRRIPEAVKLNRMYGNADHGDLPYYARNILNLAVNHPVQSTAASIINRISIDFCKKIIDMGIKNCYIVMQVHDELVVECLESDSQIVAKILKDCMEKSVVLPNVELKADPKIGKNLGELK